MVETLIKEETMKPEKLTLKKRGQVTIPKNFRELLGLNGRPYPKGLRVKKMKSHKFVFEASPTMSIRITFHYVNPNYLVLRNVVPHNITLANP